MSSISQILFYDELHEPREVVNFGNLNGDGGPEVLLSAYDQVNRQVVFEIRDCLTGTLFQPGDAITLAQPNPACAVNISEAEVEVCIPEVSNVDWYYFYRNGVLIGKNGSNCFVDTTFNPGTFYYYSVRVSNGAIFSPLSDPVVLATPGTADWNCDPEYYVDYAFYTYAGRTKIAALGLCSVDNSPHVYIIDLETGALEAENIYFDFGYIPAEISIRQLDGQIVIDVTADNGSGEIEGPESRDISGQLIE